MKHTYRVGSNISPQTLEWISDKWHHALQVIDESSWLILNKAVMTRLPLTETQEIMPNDYVDKSEGFVYRIRELQDHEERPQATAHLPQDGPVQLDPVYITCNQFNYFVGSLGYLKFWNIEPGGTAREHENLAYVASRNPATFRVPKVLWLTKLEKATVS